jgi:hypothetical protein
MSTKLVIVSLTGEDISVDDTAIRSYFMKAKGAEKAFFAKSERIITKMEHPPEQDMTSIIICSNDDAVTAGFVTVIFKNPVPWNVVKTIEELEELKLVMQGFVKGLIASITGHDGTITAETDGTDIWYRVSGQLGEIQAPSYVNVEEPDTAV